MMINDENRKSIKAMLKSKSLYAAVGVCILAAGAVGFNAMNVKPPRNTAEVSTTKEKTTYKNVNDPVFHDEVPTLKKAEPVSENVTEAQPTESAEPSTAAVFENGSPSLGESAEAEEPISFSLPVNGKLCRDYSMGLPVFSATMNDYRTHNGIDIVGEAGQGVKAAAPGKVTAVYADPVWGNTVEIDHGSGYTTRISGLADEGLVAVGCEVYHESVIGVIGVIPVEEKDEPHVHFEVRCGGELKDPLEILGFTETDD